MASGPVDSLRRHPEITLDLRDGALGRIEELGRDRLPAAELLDREQVLRRRELVLVLGEDLLVDRAVAALGPDALALVGEQEVEERLRGLRVVGLRR